VFDTDYLGIARTQGLVIVQITLNIGRTTADKKRLFAALASRLSGMAGVAPGDVFVSLLEVSRDNWSFGNGDAQLAVK
jgi:phenylpyruvate tautomerase PptA (4-oxalocrotonate tautomerase family)